MACTDLNVTTSMDETIMVKGCLGLLPCGRRSKASGKKSSSAAGDKTTKGRSAPVPAVSSPTKVAKPSAAVLPSPRHSLPQNQKKTEEITKNSTANINSKPSLHDAVKGQLQLGFNVDGQTILVQIFEAQESEIPVSVLPGRCLLRRRGTRLQDRREQATDHEVRVRHEPDLQRRVRPENENRIQRERSFSDFGLQNELDDRMWWDDRLHVVRNLEPAREVHLKHGRLLLVEPTTRDEEASENEPG